MSSVSVALIGPGYGYLPSDGGNEQPKPLHIELDSSCEGNVVTLYRRNTPELIRDAQVTVTDVTGAPLFSGNTDANGQITFEGCGKTVIIYASKSGYKSEEETFDLVPCEQCEEGGPVCGDGVCEQGETTDNCPEDCPPATAPPGAGEEQPPPTTGPEFECTSNADCEDAEYCAMLATAAGGNCEPVVGECGYAANHAWVAYECGDEAGCPTCDTGYECSDHSCVYVGTPPGGQPGAGDGGAAPPGAGEEPGGGEDGGFPWLFLLGGLIIVGAAAYWFLMQGSAGRGR